jgi:acyl dehydratase
VVDTRYAEDLAVGSVLDLGTYRVGVEEIIEFAQQWDPQVFHIDQVAAQAGFFGDVIASGVHSVAIFQRLSVLGAYRHWAVIAGRRVVAEFPAPVRSGLLTASLIIERVELTQPDRGLVVTRGRLVDERDVTVLETTVEALVRRRPGSPHPPLR